MQVSVSRIDPRVFPLEGQDGSSLFGEKWSLTGSNAGTAELQHHVNVPNNLDHLIC